MAISKSEARGMAAEYRAMMAQRDSIISQCRGADLPVSEIARLMGVSRKLIYDVTALAARQAARNSGNPYPADAALDQLRARLARDSWPASAGRDPFPVFLPPPCNPAEF